MTTTELGSSVVRQLKEAIHNDDVELLQKCLHSAQNPLDCSDEFPLLPPSNMTVCAYSAAAGSIKCLKFLALNGADLNTSDSTRWKTPVMLAAEKNHASCLDVLLSAGARVNTKDLDSKTALHYACENNSVDCLILLILNKAKLDVQDSEGMTPLMVSAARGHAGCVTMLLNHKASPSRKNVTGCTALMSAVISGHLDCVKILHTAGSDLNTSCHDGTGVLYHAVKCQHHDILRYVMANNVRPTFRDRKTGWMALHFAAENKDLCSIKVLLRYGHPIDCRSTHDGVTPLMLAARSGSELCVRYLLHSSALVDMTDFSGRTALFYCGQTCRNSDSVDTLVQHGAAVNHRDNTGSTALIRATDSSITFLTPDVGSLNIVESLLRAGSDVTLANHDGDTAMTLAFIFDHREQYIRRLSLFLKHRHEIPAIIDAALSRLRSAKCDMLVQIFTRNSFLVVDAENGQRFQESCCDCSRPENYACQDERGYRHMNNHRRKCFRCISSNKFSNKKLPSLAQAFITGNVGMAKYILVNLTFRLDDLHSEDTLDAVKRLDDQDRAQFDGIWTQPWPLSTLSLLVVSQSLGFCHLSRMRRIAGTGLPKKIQNMLNCQTERSQLCISHWRDIPLAFEGCAYESLPRARPLLYNWPIGRDLSNCDCFRCQGQDLTFL